MLTIEAFQGKERALAEALAWNPQAILATSKYALKYLAELTAHRSLPVFTIAQASAEYVRRLGFKNVTEAGGSAKTLIKTVREKCRPGAAPLLYLRGEHISIDIARALKRSGFKVESVTLYHAHAADRFSAQLCKTIESGTLDAVFFFSQRSAATYVKLAKNHALGELHRRINALCMSAAIAEKAGVIDWHNISVAEKADMQSMLALTDTLPG